MDSHNAAQLAFGAPISRKSLGGIFGRVASSTRRVGTLTRTTHKKRRHHKKNRPTHHRTSGVVIPKEMLKMLVFVSVVDKIRGRE